MSKTVIVPVSGGKDSQVVLSLAIKCGHTPVCVHQNTGYDHPVTYKHMEAMESFYNVKIHHTISKYGGMFGFLEQAGYFPNTAARGCTERLKQEPFAAWLNEHEYTEDNSELWFGMRADESANRAGKYGMLTPDDVFTLGDISNFYNKGKNNGVGKISCRLPIVNWTTEEVFSYLKAEAAPINPLYSTGHHRVGCYPCLLARKAEWEAAARDETGIDHINRLISLEEKWKAEGNHRKFVKVHRIWDVRKFLEGAQEDLPDADGECGYCSI